jgi:hypothetical protein
MYLRNKKVPKEKFSTGSKQEKVNDSSCAGDSFDSGIKRQKQEFKATADTINNDAVRFRSSTFFEK